MAYLEAEHWPLWIGGGILIIANVCNQLTGKVPNWMTLPTLLSGLLLAAALSMFPELLPPAAGGMRSTLLALVLGGGVAVGLWVAALAPGGCMKMHVAFCAWIGCGLAAGGRGSLFSTLGAFVFGAAAYIAFSQLRRPNQVDTKTPPQSAPVIPLQPFTSLGAVFGLLMGRYLGVF